MDITSQSLIDKSIIFFMCDIQDKFKDVIYEFSDIVEVSNRLIKAAHILKIPLIVTEQYPKGLGNTLKEINIETAYGVYEKTQFSMLTADVQNAISQIYEKKLVERKYAVIFGVETHICILQSVVDMIKQGFKVFVIADATSSRSQMDRLFAFKNLRAIGAYVTTSECLLFQLLSDKNHSEFKEIQAIIKIPAPTSGFLTNNLLK